MDKLLENLSGLLGGLLVVAALAVVVLGPVTCQIRENDQIAAVVSAASDPMAARCAMGGTHTLQTAACTLKAAENLKK